MTGRRLGRAVASVAACLAMTLFGGVAPARAAAPDWIATDGQVVDTTALTISGTSFTGSNVGGIAVFNFNNVTIGAPVAVTVSVTGSRPLKIVATGTISIANGLVRAEGSNGGSDGSAGAGGPGGGKGGDSTGAGTCTRTGGTGTGAGQPSDRQDWGGGGGGFGGTGENGGMYGGGSGTTGAGGSGYGNLAAALQGGSGGAAGGCWGGGGGGGAIQLVADTINIDLGIVSVDGGHGQRDIRAAAVVPAAAGDGGSGGGSGGGIILYGRVVNTHASNVLAHGGMGGVGDTAGAGGGGGGGRILIQYYGSFTNDGSNIVATRGGRMAADGTVTISQVPAPTAPPTTTGSGLAEGGSGSSLPLGVILAAATIGLGVVLYFRLRRVRS